MLASSGLQMPKYLRQMSYPAEKYPKNRFPYSTDGTEYLLSQ
jgi:hypothetical protein